MGASSEEVVEVIAIAMRMLSMLLHACFVAADPLAVALQVFLGCPALMRWFGVKWLRLLRRLLKR